MNEIIREAMIGALHEVAASSSKEVFTAFIAAIGTIREELVLTYMADKYVELHIWPLFRKEVDLTKALLNATVNFTLAIDNIGGAIEEFSNKAVSFTVKSKIVDDDLMLKSVSQQELTDTLLNNHWLFFLLFASTQMYLVNAVASQYVVI